MYADSKFFIRGRVQEKRRGEGLCHMLQEITFFTFDNQIKNNLWVFSFSGMLTSFKTQLMSTQIMKYQKFYFNNYKGIINHTSMYSINTFQHKIKIEGSNIVSKGISRAPESLTREGLNSEMSDLMKEHLLTK